MPFSIVRNDITRVKADAIVDSANPRPVIGSGCDSAVYAAAGEEKLLAARKKIGCISRGEAAWTEGFSLPAKYIIHTVGPVWEDGKHGEQEILRRCYRSSLVLADSLGCRSIAFPLLASGVYRFPKDEALQTALEEISRFLMDHEMQVTLAVFDRKAFQLSKHLTGQIDAYIDDRMVRELREKEHRAGGNSRICDRDRTRFHAPDVMTGSHITGSHIKEANETGNGAGDFRAAEDAAVYEAPALPRDSRTGAPEPESLDQLLESPGETFQERLLELIDESGMNDVTVYKKANIDRKLFSKIRSRKDYHPKKKTAVAFAIALGLDMDGMRDLLGRAGIALSPSDPFDLIISFFVSRRDYDIFEINAALFRYGQPILGS